MAFHRQGKRYLIAEVEGVSSGQPEQKLYKAIGQVVMAAGDSVFEGWERSLVIVVQGDDITKHLMRAHALTQLGVSAVVLGCNKRGDRWLFGGPPFPGEEGT